MGKRAPQPKRTEVDIFDDVDLDCAQAMLSDATGEALNKPTVLCGPETSAVLSREGQVGLSDGVPPTEAVPEPDAQIVEDASPEPVAVELTNVLLKFRVRQATRAQFDLFKAELSVALGGTRLTDANIGRALLDWILFEVADEILEAAKEEPGLRRPPSDDAVAMSAFDEMLRGIVRRGVLARAV